jgi:hypothetical protein
MMKKTTIVLGAILALGMSAPSWAQGGSEHTDNGPSVQNSGRNNGPARPGNMGRTTGQGSDANRNLPGAPNAQSGGRPNNPTPGPTDRSGNTPSENR